MNSAEVISLLQRQKMLLDSYAVDSVYVFGSVARGTADANSDVDLLVSFKQPISLIKLIRFRNELSSVFGCPVDVVTEDSLHPALAPQILKERVRAA